VLRSLFCRTVLLLLFDYCIVGLCCVTVAQGVCCVASEERDVCGRRIDAHPQLLLRLLLLPGLVALKWWWHILCIIGTAFQVRCTCFGGERCRCFQEQGGIA
jgi:hypothetical protein